MNELNTNTIIEAVGNIANSVGQTANAIATIKGIKRTTGISKKQANRLKLEAETNIAIANEFKKWCDDNPGFLYVSKVGNMMLTNVTRVLDYAQDEFTKDENIPKQQLDPEWLTKFLDIAGQTANEEKQKILAKVLCGQLKKPNSISYRALGILKDMSEADILLFRKAISVSFHDNTGLMLLPRESNKRLHVSIGEIMKLGECGLLDNSDFRNLNVSNGNIDLLSSDNNYLIRISSKTMDAGFELNAYFFTSSASELYNFLKVPEADVELLKDYARVYQTDKLETSLFKFSYKKDNLLYFTTENLL